MRGRSLLPLVRREADEVNDAVFAEITFHAAYEPQRAMRTQRYKYIRRFDDGPTAGARRTSTTARARTCWSPTGWPSASCPRRSSTTCVFDPAEAANLAADPAHADVLRRAARAARRVDGETDDPLLDGPVEPPPGAELNDPDAVSPADQPVAHR